jgi:hypothetical protein
MTEVPDPGRDIPPPHTEQMREFFSLYGSFLQLWQSFELVIEIAIMRQLNLSIRHASIVLNSLNFSAKSSILLALLKEDAERIRSQFWQFQKAQTQAERNDFAHSFLTHWDEGQMQLVRRNVRNGNYSVGLRDVSATTMHDHGHQFAEALRTAHEALGITEVDVDQYVTEIESHA